MVIFCFLLFCFSFSVQGLLKRDLDVMAQLRVIPILMHKITSVCAEQLCISFVTLPQTDKFIFICHDETNLNLNMARSKQECL